MVLGHLPDGKDVVFGRSQDPAWVTPSIPTPARYSGIQGGRRRGTFGGMQSGTTFDGKTVYFPNSDITNPEPGGLHAVDPVTGQRLGMRPP